MIEYMIEHEELTKEMKEIFGDDIVKKAFRVGYSEEVARRPFKMDSHGIDLNQEEIIVEFLNGRMVSVWNSECGSVEKHDQRNEKYVAIY